MLFDMIFVQWFFRLSVKLPRLIVKKLTISFFRKNIFSVFKMNNFSWLNKKDGFPKETFYRCLKHSCRETGYFKILIIYFIRWVWTEFNTDQSLGSVLQLQFLSYTQQTRSQYVQGGGKFWNHLVLAYRCLELRQSWNIECRTTSKSKYFRLLRIHIESSRLKKDL